MRFYKDLYVGEKARKNIRKIRHNIGRGKLQAGVCVIILSACRSDLLDILPAHQLVAERYTDALILGVAASKAEAMEVGRDIIMDVYEKTGGFNVHGYFS